LGRTGGKRVEKKNEAGDKRVGLCRLGVLKSSQIDGRAIEKAHRNGYGFVLSSSRRKNVGYSLKVKKKHLSTLDFNKRGIIKEGQKIRRRKRGGGV